MAKDSHSSKSEGFTFVGYALQVYKPSTLAFGLLFGMPLVPEENRWLVSGSKTNNDLRFFFFHSTLFFL